VEARALRNDGLTLPEIADRLKLSYGSVQRLLAGIPSARKAK
jgi:orotate phosphoribosyltransferase-like protein